MRPAPLNPLTRAASLRALARTSPATPLDVLVVGGGVTGAGIALDAASRGLSVGIVEAADWATGTSSRSSKLIHGGLRYLEMLDFPLVAEALKERDLLLTRIAPHLVKPVSFILPFENPLADRVYVGSGVTLYDVMSARVGQKRAVPTHRQLGAAQSQERFPGLAAPYGGIEYYDAQVDDARFTQALVRSAVGLGASAANYARVVDYLREDAPAADEAGAAGGGSDGARVTGARIRDEETGAEVSVHAHATILATGVWTGEQQAAADADTGLEVLASKGIHVTVPRDRIDAPARVGVITRTETSVLFIIPWGELWLIGTTDTPWREDVGLPLVTATDIDRVLEGANAVLERPLTREDVVGSFAGLRPLLQPVDGTGDSARVSREHAVLEVAPGLSAIAGGKFTTYRVMAADAVDFAVRSRFPRSRSRTEDLPLLGADGAQLSASRRSLVLANRDLRAHGWDEARLDRLLSRYGGRLADLFALIDAEPALACPLPGAEHCTAAEVVYAVRAEGALHLEDVLHRRLRLEFEVPDRGVAAAEVAARLVAPVLGWDEDRVAEEVARFTSVVDARLRAEAAETDAGAVEAVAAARPGGGQGRRVRRIARM
ncbi:glycerol-3-phosphate dehydrogenase/oxidase [Brevibacterium jeotgali]|uniref:Glycerol-3-phosphate dehydrogenase n=1 Tax=Brevibacterium jeotgali TaxID=1262550 RepID=A0A2H1L512_9MICO|nr:glycerol-3-phosphate dehydrogenase/oxidase [Brevibacterium jeotgali]TWC01397.1 glycerol-3-phosphate dehydrogenase [Brevibacterium jeotgali]SMY11998.1 glycerol-3-phosphate dehydrogenase [Brevibacterium jeotgali]